MKGIFGKEVIRTDNSDFYKETRYHEDMRVIFIAHFLDKKLEEMEIFAQIKGLFKYYYKKTSFIRKFLAIIAFMIIIFQKPGWCKELGENISEDCTTGIDGVKYYTLSPFYIDGKNITAILYLIMYFLLAFHALKIHYSEKIVRSELTKLFALLGFFSASLIVIILECFAVIPETNTTSLLNLLFVFFYFKVVLRSVKFFFKMFSYSWEVLMLWIVNVFVFSLAAAIAFENVNLGYASHEQGYSFATFTDSFNTIISLIFMGNFPEILLDAHAKNPLSILIFAPYLLFTVCLIGGCIAGNYYFHFKMCYIENLNRIYGTYPEFGAKLISIVQQKFIDPDIVATEMTELAEEIRAKKKASRKSSIFKEAKYEMHMKKIKKTIYKIQALNQIHKQKNFVSIKNLYLKTRKAFIYKLIDFILSSYAFILPLISLSKGAALSISENFQTSELLGTIFFIDLLLYHKYSDRENFWSIFKILELVSCVGMIAFSHIMYLYPLDYRSSSVIRSEFFFVVWALCNFLKIWRIHKIFNNSIDYKIICKTLSHLLPTIQEFLILYALLVIICSTIAFIIFGSKYNSDLLELYRHRTKKELEAVYSFNDMVSSIVSFCFMNIGGGFDQVGIPAIVAFSKENQNKFASILLTLFFYMYIVISEFMIANLIIGFTLDFMFANGDNNADIIKENRKFTSETNIIDRLLDLKKLETKVLEDPHTDKAKAENVQKSHLNLGMEKVDRELSLELSNDFESFD